MSSLARIPLPPDDFAAETDRLRSWRRLEGLAMVSLLVHLWLYHGGWVASWLRPRMEPSEAMVAVRFLPEAVAPQPPPQPEPEPARQIVDIPPANRQEPSEARFLAKEANAAPEESIAPIVAPPRNTPAPPPSQPMPPANEHDLADDVLEPQKAPDPTREGSRTAAELLPSERQPQPPIPSVPIDTLRQIAQDEAASQDNRIDDVPYGAVTLLNARSSPYAEYIIERTRAIVRYMSINIPLHQWRFSDVEGFRNPLEVLARVRADGEVEAVEVYQPSGSPKLDRVVSSAARSGLLGRPPPEGALQADGTMHFVFILHDGWVQAGLR